MTLNQIIGNKEKTSRIDTELWKKINEKYSDTKKETTTQIPKKNTLEQKITYNEIEKPKIPWIYMKDTAINSRTQKEYDTLMQILESAEYCWNFDSKIMPTKYNNVWKFNREQTSINISAITKTNKKTCGYSDIEYYKKNGYRIISNQTLYDIQKITPEIIKKLNKWYNTNKPDRASKGPKTK